MGFFYTKILELNYADYLLHLVKVKGGLSLNIKLTYSSVLHSHSYMSSYQRNALVEDIDN